MPRRIIISRQDREVQVGDREPSLLNLVSFLKRYPEFIKQTAHLFTRIDSFALFVAQWEKEKSVMWPKTPRLLEFQKHMWSMAEACQNVKDYDHETYWGILKGRLLEKLVGDVIAGRYTGPHCAFADNAAVSVLGRPVVYENHASRDRKETLDIAGIREDPEEGTFFETKVLAKTFGQDEREYLMMLANRLDEIGFPAVVGGVCLMPNRLFQRGATYGHLVERYPRLKWYGWEDIKDRHI